MKVQDAIKYLSELVPEEEILIAWWERDPEQYTEEEWNVVIDNEHKMDWSHNADMIDDTVQIHKYGR